MADKRDTELPGFKKNKQDKASNLRDKITNLLKEPSRPIHESTKMSIPSQPDSSADIQAKSDPASYTQISGGSDGKSADMDGSYVHDAISAVKKAQADYEGSDGFKIKTPKKKSSKADIQASDKGPSSSGEDSGEDRVESYDGSGEYGDDDIDLSVDKEYALSLKYQMPPKLAKLEKDKLKKLSEWVLNQVRDIQQERSVFMQKLMRYRAIWLDFVAVGMNPLWEGAHNVHIPMAFEKIKAMHARLYQAIFGIDPPFSLKPRTAISEKQKYEKEQLLNFVIKDYANKGAGWEAAIDKDIWNFVADGTSVTKQYWSREVNKYTDVESVFTGFKNGVPQYKDKNKEVEQVEFDGPMIKPVDLEDFFITGNNVDNADVADLVAERVYYTKSDIIKLTKQGYFFEDAVDAVLQNDPQMPMQTLHADSTTLKQEKYDLAGVTRYQSGIKTYECFEAYCRYDIDDDGIDEDLVVWIERHTGKILRLTYLERACPGKMRPFTIKRFIDRPGSPYGIGMGEMLYGINNELDYIHNQRLDYGTLQNLPFGFVRASSSLNQPKPMRLAPGMLYPTDDPQTDVSFPRLNGGTGYGFQEEAQVSKYADSVSGISQFSLGSTAAQGPTRTATGAAALVNEINANLDIHIKRYQRGFKRNLAILDKQIISLLPLGLIIRLTGMDGKAIMMQFENRKAIDFPTDYELTANSVNSNKAIERDTSTMLLQMLQNPLALQGGLVGPENLYNAYKNLLQKYDVKDIDAYISRPADQPESPYSGKDELSAILAGVRPPVYLRDRHQEKLAFFDAFENSEEFGWFTPEHISIYMQVKNDHQKMMEAVASQQQQTGMGNVVNPALGAQIAAASGAPNGVPQQMSDLMGQSSPMADMGSNQNPGA